MVSLTERLESLDRGWGGRLLYAAGIALLFGLLAWEGIAITRGSGRVAAIWLPNAVLVAFALAFRRPLPSLLLPGIVGNVVADLLVGDVLVRAVALSLVNGIETGLAITIARRFVRRAGTITHPRQLFGYVGASVIAAGFSGFLAALLLADAEVGVLALWQQWSMADGLALITVVPILLILFQALDQRAPLTWPRLAEWGLWLGGSGLLFAYIFIQSQVPLLFLAIPAVMLCAFRLGAPGAAAALLEAGAAAAVGAVLGLGPLRAVHADIHVVTQVQQLFLFATFLSTLPVVLSIENAMALQSRLNRILNSMNEVAFALDDHGRWTFLNDRWQVLFGLAPSAFLGRSALTLLSAPERRALLHALKPLLTGKTSGARHAFVVRLPYRRPMHLEVSLGPLEAEDGESRGWAGTLRDRTAEVESEAARRASEQKMDALTRLAPVGIFHCDRSGAVTFVNRAWEGITGIPAERALGNGWIESIHPEAQGRVLSAWHRAIGSGVRTEGDFRYLRPNGETVWVRGIMSGVRDGDGRLTGFVGVVIDTTQERAARQESERALAVAEASVQAKERFLANVSHELRTPMNGILGFAERLQAGTLTPEQHRHVRLIAESGAVMVAMLNDILDMSRLAAGPVALAQTAFVPADMVQDLCAFVDPLLEGRPVLFRPSIDPGLRLSALGDAARLAQIVRNLLGNAVKFTHRGTIALTARREERRGQPWMTVEVADTGIGIAPAEQAIVFEEFAQANDGIATRYGGTGLGLAISRSLAEAMGGELDLVDSAVGRGSRFRLAVPLSGTVSGAGAEAADGTVPDGALAGLHVLVADDNPINRELLRDIGLELGCRVAVVADGDAAVRAVVGAAAGDDPFSMVLMDVRMPKMDGLEATRLIRGSCDAESLSIVAISANCSRRDRQACAEAGMQDSVAKPFTRASVARVMARWRPRVPVPASLAALPAAVADRPVFGVAVDASRAGAGPSRRAAARLRRLRPRFEDQCRACRQELAAAMACWPHVAPDRFAALQTMAHNIAGTAALFDGAALGERARELDEMLDDPGAAGVASGLIALAKELEKRVQTSAEEGAPAASPASQAQRCG